MRWFVVLWYTRRQSILFCWVAWCNMMCKLRADDAGGCDDHLCEPRPRVLSTLLEGSLQFWGRLHSRNPSHMSAGCEVFSHQRLVKPPTFIGSSSLCVINPSWGIAPILGLVEEHFTGFFCYSSSGNNNFVKNWQLIALSSPGWWCNVILGLGKMDWWNAIPGSHGLLRSQLLCLLQM